MSKSTNTVVYKCTLIGNSYFPIRLRIGFAHVPVACKFCMLILIVHRLLHTVLFCTPPSTYWLFCTPPSTYWLFLFTTFYILTLFIHHFLHTYSFCTPSTYWLLYTTYILTLFVHHLLHTDSFCPPPSTYWRFFIHHLLLTYSYCPPPSTYWRFLYTTFYLLTFLSTTSLLTPFVNPFYVLTLFVYHPLHTMAVIRGIKQERQRYGGRWLRSCKGGLNLARKVWLNAPK